MTQKNVVLITGLPGSGKSRFGELLCQRLQPEGCIRLDGTEIRRELFPHLADTLSDHDVLCRSVSIMTRMYMRHASDPHCIVELTCPDSRAVNSFKTQMRNTLHTLTHVWMDTIDSDECKYKDIAALWSPPTDMQFQAIGYHFSQEMQEAVTVVAQHLKQPNSGPYPVMI